MKGIAIFFPSQQFALGPLKLCFPHSSVGKESACNAEDPSLIPRPGRSTSEGIDYSIQCSWASLVAQLVKNLPTTGDLG